MAEPVFKPPVMTSAAQRRVEDLAERVDAWKIANYLVRAAGEWDAPVGPIDVLQLASFLAGHGDD